MLYEDFSRRQNLQKDLAAVNGTEPAMHVFQALQYLLKLCSHPSLVLTQHHPLWQLISKELQTQGRTLSDVHNAPKLQALKTILQECGIAGKQTRKETD